MEKTKKEDELKNEAGFLNQERMAEHQPTRSWRTWLIGHPLPTADAPHQTVSKMVGLAVFGADALSSIAYAPQETLVILAAAGTQALGYAFPISLVITLLLAIVSVSYLQTIRAYPSGGGAYTVVKENLGETAALVAGAALLMDYILLAAVTVASGVAQIVSAFPDLFPFRVWLSVGLLGLIAIANLRGVKESGNIFALPTYFFLGMTMLMVVFVAPFGVITALVGVPLFVSAVYLVPRVVGRRWAERLVARAVPWVERVGRLLAPFVPDREPTARTALAAVLSGGEGAALARTNEIEIVSGVLAFADRPVRELMTPRTTIVAVPEGMAAAEAAHVLTQAGYSRYPVYRGTLDEIVGVTHAIDLLRLAPDDPVVVRPALTVPRTTRAADLMLEMQRGRGHLAVVLDEFGGTMGVVTFEDLLRDLVAETRVHAASLVQPHFVVDDDRAAIPVAALPGIHRHGVEPLLAQVEADLELGVRSVLLFGVVDDKDAVGSAGHDPASPVHRAVDQLQVDWWLSKTREWLTVDDPRVQALLGKESPEHLAARLTTQTKLDDVATRRALWQGGLTAIQASTDPLIQYALSIQPVTRAIRREWEEAVQAPTDRASERLADARFAVFGDTVAPDATATLRLTYGKVEGSNVPGQRFGPFTTFAGLWDRATGAPPFDVAPKLLAARSRIDPSTVLDMTVSTDTIGGSSGSPAVNAAGEIIGANFDSAGNAPEVEAMFEQ